MWNGVFMVTGYFRECLRKYFSLRSYIRFTDDAGKKTIQLFFN